MKTTLLRAVRFITVPTPALFLLLALWPGEPARLAQGQVKELPTVYTNRHCQPTYPQSGSMCLVCPGGARACEYQLPAGFVNGVCEACSGCGGQVCLYYATFECGRGLDCVTGDFTGGDCGSLPGQWCK